MRLHTAMLYVLHLSPKASEMLCEVCCATSVPEGSFFQVHRATDEPKSCATSVPEGGFFQ